MEIYLKTIEQIKDEIFGENKEAAQTTPFHETIDFTFSELYKEIVTNINPTNISSRCELYNSTYSTDITEIFYDVDWIKNEYKKKIKDYWFIGEDNSSDYWIMDKNGKIFYWESGGYKKKYTLENIMDVNINFQQWLQFAYIDKDIEEILENLFDSGMDEANYALLENEFKEKYKNKVQEISKELYELIKSRYD